MKDSNPQFNVWDKNWKRKDHKNLTYIINSKFTKKAFSEIGNYISENDKMILETGSGTGRLCCMLGRKFPKSKFYGIDFSASSIRIAESLKDFLKVKNVYFQRGDMFNLPYRDGEFNVVFNEGVLEHYRISDRKNYISALKEMIRVTKKGGRIIVAVPNWNNFPHTIYKFLLRKFGKRYIYGYEKSFKKKDLTKIFKENGLVKIEISGFYPAHGFYRLSGIYGGKIFKLFGLLVDVLEFTSDLIISKRFSKYFGFEIVIKGVKK